MLSLALFAALAAPAGPGRALPHPVGRRGFKVGLGKVLTTEYRGQIFNFDVNQSGTDGIVTEAPVFGSAAESFDATTGKITRVIAKTVSPSYDHELVTYGIFANDLGFVDLERVSFRGNFVDRHDRYDTIAPVTGGKVTGAWTHPHDANTIIWWVAANQTTQTQFVFAYELRKGNESEIPWVYAANFAAGTTKRFRLDQDLFGVASVPQIAQDSTTNQAVIALSPDGGRVGGDPPLNVLVDLQTGKETQFNGLNNGVYGSGGVNGVAVDSTSGIECTTTELNAQVEFYNLANETGVAAQLPGTTDGSQFYSADTVANDPVNGLFLVAQPFSSSTQSGSTIYVYNEAGSLVETINGFNFTNADSEVYGYPGLHLNPSARMGYINGPGADQLQQFFY